MSENPIPEILNTLKEKIKAFIKLKLSVIIALLIIGTIVMMNLIIMPAQEKSISEKAVDVCTVLALSISATAVDTLLTGQNILLNDIVRGLRKQKIDGLEEIAIVFKKKYFVNSIKKKSRKRVPKKLYKRLRIIKSKTVVRNEITYRKVNGEKIEAFEFIKTIVYLKKRIGITRIIYDKNAIRKEVDHIKELTLNTAIIVVLISFIFVYIVAWRMSKPILKIAEAAIEVEKGNLDINLNINSLDEVGILAHEFNSMVKELREKFHMMKFVSKSTVSMIKDKSDSEDLKLGGSHKDLAFLFSDVRGFTAMTEKNKPEAVVAILNEYLDLQSRVIKKYNGDIDKFVGDEIMAVFSGENKEDDCLTAAIAVIKSIHAINSKKKALGKETLAVGLGIHCGDVIVGNMGSQDRMDFTAIGDAVNLSARLCSAAPPFKILASRKILAAAKGKYKTEKLEPIMVKGKEKPIEIYSLLDKIS